MAALKDKAEKTQGPIRAQLAHEGAAVKAGESLLRLDDTRAKAELEQLRSKSPSVRRGQ